VQRDVKHGSQQKKIEEKFTTSHCISEVFHPQFPYESVGQDSLWYPSTLTLLFMELDPSQFYPIKPIGLSKKIPDQPDELEIRKGHRAYLIMVVQYPS
jgi:hypothetical protein